MNKIITIEIKPPGRPAILLNIEHIPELLLFDNVLASLEQQRKDFESQELRNL